MSGTGTTRFVSIPVNYLKKDRAATATIRTMILKVYSDIGWYAELLMGLGIWGIEQMLWVEKRQWGVC